MDQDLGKSGTTTEGREAFPPLEAAVGSEMCGPVLALEASRLSRSLSRFGSAHGQFVPDDTLIGIGWYL